MKKPSSTPSTEIAALLDKAEERLEKSDYAEAEKLANEVLVLASGKGKLSLNNKARTLCILGECCWKTSRNGHALMHFDNALSAAEAASNLSLQSRALNGTATVKYRSSEYNAALVIAERSLAFAEKNEDKKQQAKILSIIGNVHNDRADYLRALDYYTRSLALAQEIGDKYSVATNLGNIGNVHHHVSSYPRALDYLTRALVLAEEISDKHLIAINLANIGNLHRSLADYPRALDYFTRALAISEEIGDKNGVAIKLTNIGNVHSNLADYPRAQDYYTRAFAISEEIGNKNSVAINLGNIGMAYMYSGDYTEALEYLKRALDLCEEIGARRPAGYWMNGIAEVEHKLGNLDAAHQGFLDTLHHRHDVLNSNDDVTLTLIELGGVLAEKGRSEEGLARFEEALTLAGELGEKKRASDAHQKIADAYAKKGDFTQAFEHLTKHLALEKEIFSEESKKSVERFNMRVKIAEIEHGVEMQKTRADHFERELTIKALAYASQTEMIGKFREDLRRIIRKIEAHDPAINELIIKLRDLPDGVNWKEFEEEFLHVHPEFSANLLKKYPDLTEIELRVSALLRLKLTTPDIARLLSLSERTIDNHRHRIRKKINLDAKEDFAKFLSRF